MQRPLESGEIGKAPLISTRVKRADADWLSQLVLRTSLPRSEILRRLIQIGRQHEEELTRAS